MLFAITAAIECGAGLALVCCPSVLVMILIGVPVHGPAAWTVARVEDSGLLALTLACWLAREDVSSRSARSLVAGITIYNAFTATFLADAGIGYQLQGPAIVLIVDEYGAMPWSIGRGTRPKEDRVHRVNQKSPITFPSATVPRRP